MSGAPNTPYCEISVLKKSLDDGNIHRTDKKTVHAVYLFVKNNIFIKLS